MSARPRFDTVDEYLAATEPAARQVLETIRAGVRRALPDAAECIGYQMPAYAHGGKIFFYVAAFKHHIGVYPPLKAGSDLDASLARYRGAKGNLRFPLDEPMPYALIARLAVALARQRDPAGAALPAQR